MTREQIESYLSLKGYQPMSAAYIRPAMCNDKECLLFTSPGRVELVALRWYDTEIAWDTVSDRELRIFYEYLS